jgi:hypothetical protein
MSFSKLIRWLMGRLTTLSHSGRVRGNEMLFTRGHNSACSCLKLCKLCGVRRLDFLRNSKTQTAIRICSDVHCLTASGGASAAGAERRKSIACCMLVNDDVERGEVPRDARVRMRRCKLTPCSTVRFETKIARARWASAYQSVLVLGGCTDFRVVSVDGGHGLGR